MDFYQPPLKKQRENAPTPTVNNENVDYVVQKYYMMYKKCEDDYKINTLSLKSDHDKLKESIEKQETDSRKLLIAFYGAPGQRKSSTINFLLSGNKKWPLPTSGASGKGCTRIPIRCRFTNNENTKVTAEDSNGEVICEKKYKTLINVNLNKEFESYIDQTEELIIEMPFILSDHSKYLRNLEFIDLIGLPFTEKSENFNQTIAIRKNRYSICKSRIDGVFVFDISRQQMVPDMVKYLWAIGIFKHTIDQIPKLVMVRKEEFAVENTKELEEWYGSFDDGTCKQHIERSLCLSFDYKNDGREWTADEKNDISMMMELHLPEKSKVVPEMCESADAVCLVSNGNKLIKRSKNKLVEILNDMRDYKFQCLKNANYRNITYILKDLEIKIGNKLRSSRQSVTKDESCAKLYKLMVNYLYVNKTYRDKVVKKTMRDLENYVDRLKSEDFFNIEDIIDQEESVRNENIRELFLQEMNRIFTNCSEMCHENVLIIKKAMEANIKKLNLNPNEAFLKDYLNIDHELCLSYYYGKLLVGFKDSCKKQFDIFVQKCALKSILESGDGKYKSFDKEFELAFNLFKTPFIELLDRLVTNIKFEILNEEAEKEIDGIAQILKDVKNFHNELMIKIGFDPKETDFQCDISEPIEPCLFTSNGSLKLPTEAKDYTMNECIKNKWMTCIGKKINEKIFSEGRVKSKLKLHHLEPSNTFQKYLNSHSLDVGIQIYIDRDRMKCKAEFDKSKVYGRLAALLNHIVNSTDKYTALYPIFISSKKRDNNDIEEFFEPNLLLQLFMKQPGTLERFMIFLFIEGGTPETRQKYQENINFYLEQRRKACGNAEYNPIIMVFLPEHELGIGRKRKIMMLLAEYLNLPKYYMVDDDIEEFYQYDERAKRFRTDDNTALRAFSYLSKVLDHSVENSNAAIDKTKLQGIIRKATRDFDDDVYNEINGLLYNDGAIYTNRHLIMHLLIGNLDKCETTDKLINELEDIFYHSQSKCIGQVSLVNQQSSSFNTSKQRLQGTRKTTHIVSSVRYQVVLYNMLAMKGIHPVTDKVLFDKPLNTQERLSLCRLAKNKPLENNYAARAARLGYKYSDKTHVYYQILNGVSGCLSYIFAFKEKKCHSKVDADDESCYNF